MPSEANISTNAHALARYAAICQEQGLIPIIEPEVLMDGNHDSQTCFEITARILDATFAECEVQGVHTRLYLSSALSYLENLTKIKEPERRLHK